MKNKLIGDLSKMFKVNKSTLRYWDKEGLIEFKRNPENEYRTISFKTIADVYDTSFYRNLNVSIKDLKSLKTKNILEIEEVLLETDQRISNEINELKLIQEKIKSRVKDIARYKELKNTPYTFKEPNFNKMFVLNFDTRENIIKTAEDPYLGGIFLDSKKDYEVLDGFISSSDFEEGEILWQKDTNLYINCLYKLETGERRFSNLKEHKKFLTEKGYVLGDIIGRFLISGYEDRQYDYFDAWIQVLENK